MYRKEPFVDPAGAGAAGHTSSTMARAVRVMARAARSRVG